MVATPESLVQTAEEAYNAWDMDRVLALFAPDVVFYENGKLVGKSIDDVRRWHEQLFAAVKDFEIHKTLRAASGDVVTLEFANTWVSARNDEPMQSFGGEFWTMEGDRLAEWHLYWRAYPLIEGAEGR